MSGSLLSLVIAQILTAAPIVENGTVLHYRGTMIADKGDEAQSRKEFELKLILASDESQGTTALWVTTEKGRGSWPWTEHFGQWKLDARLRGNLDNGPSLLYERDEGLSVVPLVAPLVVADEPLAKGKTWTDARLDHEVVAAEKKGDHAAWRVEVTSPFGRKRTLWVDRESPVVVALNEVVFIGQGEMHTLELRLVERSRLDVAQVANALATFKELADLKEKIGVKPRTYFVEWKPDQLASLKSALPDLTKQIGDGPLASVAKDAEADTKNQNGRSGAVAAMEKRILGREVGEFKLGGLGADSLTHEALKGNVTVLHFWEYQESPLQEPYGQAGFLDYLNRKRTDKNVAVYGVCASPLLADESTRRRAMASARKFRSFMNLSYPLLLDDGSLIKQLGDPRQAGGKLPLYVVVGADGKVVHYHAGFYDVDRARGLKELDDVITQALEKIE